MAAPPIILSVFPNGVSSASNATDPTVSKLISDYCVDFKLVSNWILNAKTLRR
ncbi:hypothetical protein D3C86_2058080 [compost metagenome]